MDITGSTTLTLGMGEKSGRGRPRELTDEQVEHVRSALRAYVAQFPKQDEAAKNLGVRQQYVSALLVKDSEKPLGKKLALKLGEVLGRDLLAEVSPQAKSDVQPKLQPYTQATPLERVLEVRDVAANDHWFPDHIEELAIKLVRLPNAPEYTPSQLRAAKVFMREMAALLKDPSDLLGTMASAAEAARALEADKKTPTFLEITLRLAQQARPKFVPPPGNLSPRDRIIAKARAQEDEDSRPPPGTHSRDDE